MKKFDLEKHLAFIKDVKENPHLYEPNNQQK